ncbi:MAG: hypothetical protein PF446_05105 [Oleiagrimonas sp.]|nr:hypothetical protein [Oleiagrimonas sp.]
MRDIRTAHDSHLIAQCRSAVALSRYQVDPWISLIAAIEEYIALHNNHPKPLDWTTKAKEILQKIHPRQSAPWFKEQRSSTATASS